MVGSSVVFTRTARIMTTHTYKTVYYADGWFEIREEENAEAWIATDAPHALVP